MSQRPKSVAASLPTLAKCPTGIRGLDDVTNGGFPRGRATLICGGSGSGKTLMGMQFLVRGIEEHGEPGVFMCIEEREQDLAENVASLGFDLPEPMRKIIGDLSNTERTLIGLQLRPVRVGKPRQT